MLFRSAAASSDAIARRSAFCSSGDRYAKVSAAVFRGQDAEDQDALVEREVGEHRGDVASGPVAQDVAEPAEIALADDGGDLVRRPRRLAHQLQRGIAVGATQFVFHKHQRCAHHIVVVHARTNGADDVEPEPVDLFEVFGAERGRMRAQVIRGRRAAGVIDDEANVHARRFARALPGFAEEPRLVVGGERFRFAGVDFGRLQPQRRFDDRVEDVHAGHDHQPDGAPFAFCRRHDGGEQLPFVFGRARILRGIVGDVHADHANRHRDDVAIARGADGADEMREHVRPADRHEEIPRARLHVAQVHIVGGQQLEFVERRPGRSGCAATDRFETTSAAVAPPPRRSRRARAGRQSPRARRPPGPGALPCR